MRHVTISLGITLLAASLAPGAPVAALNQYCAGCHNPKTKAGGFTFDPAAAPARNPEAWEKIVRKLRSRSMPPASLPRPDEATYISLQTAIEKDLDTAPPNAGRTDTFRRLNRTEYQNAVRDLFRIDVDVANLLPADESSHGFDNITVADLSPTLLDRYVTASRRIVRAAVGSPIHAPGGDTFSLPPDLTQEEQLDSLPVGTRGGTVVRYTFPLDAAYEFRLRLARDRNEHVEGLLNESHEVELTVDGERVRLFTVEPPPKGTDHHLVDENLTVRLAVKAGPHMVGAAFVKKPSLLLENERQPYQAHFNMDRHPRIQPAIYSVTVNGPFDAKGPGDTPSRRRIFVCTPTGAADQEPCAKRILSTTMRRAYRRPVTDTDLQAPLRLFREAARDGFDAGIEMGLSAVLVNPEFLFRVERDPAGLGTQTSYRLNDTDLASRLSFFLWSSIPDDQLLDLAVRGELHKTAVLEQQTRRMLADARSRSLITNFAEQWLHLRNLASLTPDMRVFPDFDDNLRRAFHTETQMFLESIMREDRSVPELLSANYSFVNERLAKHYGIPGIYGSRFRRVEFGAEFGTDAVRGGLLRQGSILSVTSYATRTSPVIRGKWILDNILGSPPPPPPPNVPVLKETAGEKQKLSRRERIAQHRANPVCASCHNIMDPLGFGLENYDAVGRWRAAENGANVDASGVLPDGTKFDGAAGLQQTLLRRPEIFVSTLTEKLLTYSLGRGTEYYDAPAVRRIVNEAGAADYRFSSIILGIVKSTPFQMRKTK